MKTLIFANTKLNRGRHGIYYSTDFIKEGDITDAISYFDGSRHFGSFFHNDEEGYWFANNDNGRPDITDEEIDKGNGEHNITVDAHAFWTKNIDNLSVEELKVLIEDADRYTIEEAIEANGYDVDSFLLAKYFDDLEHFLNDRPEDYISRNYTPHDEEPEDEKSFDLNGKFYTMD